MSDLFFGFWAVADHGSELKVMKMPTRRESVVLSGL